MRIVRVSLTVGAVVAAAVATGGTAVAAPAAKSLCYVVAKQDAFTFNAKTLEEVGKIKKGDSRDSACSVTEHELAGRVVYLKDGKTIVSAKQVTINARA